MDRTHATYCPYCALQCRMLITGSPERATIVGDKTFPVNKGKLCIKGYTASQTLAHPDRILAPLVRNASGVLQAVTWDDAFTRIAQTFQKIQAEHGKNAVGVMGGGSLTNEKAYLLGKFARVALGTAQIDYNGRFCMSSAAAASNKAFGLDRGLPFPLEDIARTEVILLVGSNIAETMPPIMQYFTSQKRQGGQLIVIDPRSSPSTRSATIHLRPLPGSDLAVAHGLMHILIRDNLVDCDYIEQKTEGFAELKDMVLNYQPERTAALTGVSSQQLTEVAHMLGTAKSAMVLTGRGAEQQVQGVNNVLSYINIALALGMVGRPYSGFGSITGQGNGQGGREHGQKSDQLPGYRNINNSEARHYIAKIWGIAEKDLPYSGKSAYEMFDAIGQPDGIRALFVMGSNIVVSAPNALHVRENLEKLSFLVVTDFFLSDTAQIADVVLPSAQWAEEDGTITNLEGRVILRRQVFKPPTRVREDREILCELAHYLGKGQFFPFTNTHEVFQELRQASAGGPADYAGITYEKIEAQDGVFWPCPTIEHPGTPRLFTENFPTPSGKARFHAVAPQKPAEQIDEEYPLYLTTGRILAHYQSGNQTQRIEHLRKMAPEPYVEIHPATAMRYAFLNGEKVRLVTRRGTALFSIKITVDIREDTVFVPFHWNGIQSANRLTNAALDPISKMPEFKICAVRIEHIQLG